MEGERGETLALPLQVRSDMGARAVAAHLYAKLTKSPGPVPGPLTIPSYDHPTALATTSWGAPAGDSTQPDPLRLGCDEQDHPLGNAPSGHRSAVDAPVSSM